MDADRSELLGSFGDNELSPECLDGAQRFLHAERGVSIPVAYTSWIAPISSSKLHQEVKAYNDVKHFETHLRRQDASPQGSQCRPGDLDLRAPQPPGPALSHVLFFFSGFSSFLGAFQTKDAGLCFCVGGCPELARGGGERRERERRSGRLGLGEAARG